MNRIGREQILALIPHGGAMCLLDEVLAWDAASVRCLSLSFHDQDNPMRRADGRLGAASGIEIAAQAMAVHGRLTAQQDGPPAPGYLVSLRDVLLTTTVLEAERLVISAIRLRGDARGATYSFTVTGQDTKYLSGRATVLFGGGQ